MFAILLLLIAQAPALQAADINPHAIELFDRDADLNAWAVRVYDRNHDGWLTLFEAQPAMRAFKAIADTDRDGRVTVSEYEQAKAFVVARWRPNR
jgi:tRNA G37 N-methylase Trm5